MDVLKRASHIEQGSSGFDDDPDNPFSRAVNRLFEDGQPFARITLCFFGDLARHAIHGSPLRWLGIFILSAGERVIFFRGLPLPLQELSCFADNYRNCYTTIKHFSLTTSLSKEIVPNGTIRPLNQKII